MLKFIPVLELPILVFMVFIRARMLRRHGIKAIVFGDTDKTDFIIIPIVLFFFYGLLSTVIKLPFPEVLTKPLLEKEILYIVSIIICTASLVWFALTLKVFGKSFRVGIDENTKDELITKGTFAFSRNPIYVGFISFFTGLLIAYSNILILVFLLLFVTVIHRQILREEIFLIGHYGIKYEEYCKNVRRYI